VVSPHPDDETLGCGGTLRKHVCNGDEVHALFLTSGEQGCPGVLPKEVLEIREQEAQAAARILGLTSLEFWREPDGALRVTAALVRRLAAKARDLRPDVVYVTHLAEMHPDHRAAARLVRAALMFKPISSKHASVLMFEVWTPIQRIDHIVDISPYIAAKLAAISAHHSQTERMRFDAAFLGLNRYRGEMHSWPGGDYAEIFQVLDVASRQHMFERTARK